MVMHLKNGQELALGTCDHLARGKFVQCLGQNYSLEGVLKSTQIIISVYSICDYVNSSLLAINLDT